MSDRWPALMSQKDAAEYIGVGLSTMQRFIADGSIVPRVIGIRRIGILRSELDEFIESLPTRTGKQADAMRPGDQQ